MQPGKGELLDLAMNGSLLISLFADGSCAALDQDRGDVVWAHSSDAFPFRPRHLLSFHDRVLVGGNAGVSLLQRDDGKILWNREIQIQSGDSWSAGEPGLLISQIQFRPYYDVLTPAGTGISNEHWSPISKVFLLGWEEGSDIWTRVYAPASVEKLDWLDSRALILSHRNPVFEWALCGAHGESDTMARIGCASCRYEQTQESMFQLEVLDPKNVQELWAREIPASSLPLVEVFDDRLTLVTPRAAYALSSSGNLHWDVEFTDRVTAATQTENDLFICLLDTQLISIDPASGKPRWQRDLEGTAESLLAGRDRLYAVLAGLDVDWHNSENPVGRFVRRTLARWKNPYSHLYFDTSGQVYFAAFRSGDGRRIWHRRIDVGKAVLGDGECFLLLQSESMDSAVRFEVNSCSPARGSLNWNYTTYARPSDVLQGEKSVFVVSTSNSPRVLQSPTAAHAAGKIIALRPRGLANRLTRL
jgi:hypothetical protein